MSTGELALELDGELVAVLVAKTFETVRMTVTDREAQYVVGGDHGFARCHQIAKKSWRWIWREEQIMSRLHAFGSRHRVGVPIPHI